MLWETESQNLVMMSYVDWKRLVVIVVCLGYDGASILMPVVIRDGPVGLNPFGQGPL